MRQEYASSNGTFSMELNQHGAQNSLQPLDASVSSTGYGNGGGGFDAGLRGNNGFNPASLGQGRSQNLSSCEIRAQLAGYQSDVITLGPRRALDSPDIGVIVLHHMDGREGGTISLKTLAAPKDARKAYEKAGKELIKKKPNLSKAIEELEKAVEIYDEFAAAWYMLGEVRVAQQDRSGAVEAFELAVTADADYANPRVSLALIALEEERWEDAAQLAEDALEISPDHIKAHYCSAVANSSLGNPDGAETSALRVQGSNEVQNYPLVYYVLGWILSQRGDFDSAAAQFRQFLEIQPEAQLAERLRAQLADWEQRDLIPESGS
jgi:tetratricopeptide (TPR) repeat protein